MLMYVGDYRFRHRFRQDEVQDPKGKTSCLTSTTSMTYIASPPPQIWFASLVSTFFLISQISAQRIHIISHLWRVSSILGFAYGNMFALLPIVTLEWFGLAHFSSVSGGVGLRSREGCGLTDLGLGASRIGESCRLLRLWEGISRIWSLAEYTIRTR